MGPGEGRAGAGDAEMPGRGSRAGPHWPPLVHYPLPKWYFLERPDGAWLAGSESYLLCLFLLFSDFFLLFFFFFAVTEAQFAIFVCFVMPFGFSSHALLAMVYYFVI